jgi:hypothetical protein
MMGAGRSALPAVFGRNQPETQTGPCKIRSGGSPLCRQVTAGDEALFAAWSAFELEERLPRSRQRGQPNGDLVDKVSVIAAM